MKIFTIFFLVFFTFFAWAKEELILQIKVEAENNAIHQLLVNLNEHGEVQQIIRRGPNNSASFSVEQLVAGGVVLAEAQGRKAVTLGCSNCTREYGGILDLEYLENGIFNMYKHLYMSLEKIDGRWTVFTDSQNPQKINLLYLRSNIWFGQLVGIRTIEINPAN